MAVSKRAVAWIIAMLMVAGGLLPLLPGFASGATVLMTDTFTRSRSSGWGTAEIGGAWSHAGSLSNYRVTGTQAESVVAAGTTRRSSSNAAGNNLDLRAALSLSRVPNGGGLHLMLGMRNTSTAVHLTRLTFASNGAVTIQLQRKVSGTATTLKSLTIPKSTITYTAGQQLVVRAQVEGTTTAALRAKVWRAGTAEPSGWQVTANDTSASAPKSGAFITEQYLSSSATAPVTVSFDELTMTTIDTAPAIQSPPNQSPSASFTTSAAGLVASFNGSGSRDPDGTIASYAWAFGDGSTGSGATASRTYAAAGTYTVRLTVTDNRGATNSTTRQVTVTAPPNQPPVASFTRTVDGMTASVNGSGSSDPDGSIASYAWSFGDGATGSGATASRTYAEAGTYAVRLTVTDNRGATNSTTQQVTVAPAENRAPVASFTRTVDGMTASVNGSGSSDPDGSIASYAWSFGDGATGSGATASHTYAEAGTYTITLTVTDNRGATNSTTQQVTVAPAENRAPVASFTRTVDGMTASVNGSGSSDPDGSIASYAWSFGDGATDTGETTEHTYTEAGTYSITLTVTDDAGATDEAVREVTVPAGGNLAPTASFTATTVGPFVTVDGAGSGDPDGSIASYEWSFGDGTTSSDITSTHGYDRAGTYTVRLTVRDDTGASDTATRTIDTRGTNYPAAHNTGVPNGVDLKRLSTSTRPYPGDAMSSTKLTIRTPGAVYDGWRFDRLVEVRAAGVVFKNCHFEGVAVNSAALLTVFNDRGAQIPSAQVEDSTFIPAVPNDKVDGVRGSNVTLRRVEISRTVDGVHIYGSTDYLDQHAGNVLIEDSWIHDLIWYDNGAFVDGTHNDGVQVRGGRNISIIGSRIDGTIKNAAIQVTQALNRIGNFTFRSNVLGGGACTININDTLGAEALTGLAMESGVFLHGSSSKPRCAMLVNTRALSNTRATGNLWHEGSKPDPVPVNRVPL